MTEVADDMVILIPFIRILIILMVCQDALGSGKKTSHNCIPLKCTDQQGNLQDAVMF